MSGRRLIGIDLAWREGRPNSPNGSGCAELVWEKGELRLTRLDLVYSLDDIVEWIKPDCGDWVIAIDAPLVVLNAVGRRQAEAQIDDRYDRNRSGAKAQSSNLTNETLGGKDHRGGRLWRVLEDRGATLVERSENVRRESKIAERLVLETYPHPAMIELFNREEVIKYKRVVKVADKRAGQQELAAEIRKHLCAAPAEPRVRLRMDDLLESLLRDPGQRLRGAALDGRGDLLDAVVCAYVAAWVDRGAPFRAFGTLGKGVIIVPWKRWMREPDG